MAHVPSNRTLITGAGRGLGLEFARQCLDRGDRVYAGVRSPDRADALHALRESHPQRLFVFPLDVANPTSVTEAFRLVSEQTDHLDVLINNAGINSRSTAVDEHQRNVKFGELEASGLVKMIEVNAIAPLLVVQTFVDLLERGNHPRILNVSSWLGSIERKLSGGNYGYCASKATLNMLGRTLAFDLQSRGIITLMFNPGWVRTDMGGERAELTPTQSVCGILGTSDTATLEDTGTFFQWDGTVHPW
ncbi:MAG: SDR family oxidoreductase [Myxococcota bacterium]